MMVLLLRALDSSSIHDVVGLAFPFQKEGGNALRHYYGGWRSDWAGLAKAMAKRGAKTLVLERGLQRSGARRGNLPVGLRRSKGARIEVRREARSIVTCSLHRTAIFVRAPIFVCSERELVS